MTLSDLRSLHAIIGRAIADIEQVYAAHSSESTSTSPSPSPSNFDPISVSCSDSETLRTGPTPPIPTHTSTSTPAIPKTQAEGESLTPTPPESECGCDIEEEDMTASNDKKSNSKAHISTPSVLVSPYRNTRASSGAYASPPPSPLVATTHTLVTQGMVSQLSSPTISASRDRHTPMTATFAPVLDFPALDAPYDAGSLSEMLTTHPRVLRAIQHIVAAAGQLAATAQTPFLTLCEAVMAYHLPSCMRLLEASHVVEILREAGPSGLSVKGISKQNGVAPAKLAHVLRLLATHHLLREVSPDVFALNRVSSLVDSGKTIQVIKELEAEGKPEAKFMDTNGIAAFVGLCTDEIQKSSAYLTETYLHPTSPHIRAGTDPAKAPFAFAFADAAGASEGFFGWLEGGGGEGGGRSIGIENRVKGGDRRRKYTGRTEGFSTNAVGEAPSRFRLERFGKAMAGTDGWEVPGAVLTGFDWAALPHGSVIVDVGGGIGSTSMILATAFAASGPEDIVYQDEGRESGAPRGLKFVIQDRAVVCGMGEKAWKAKCPELLGASVTFQVHDFFTPQPVRDAAVFLLRVVLHDWPDAYAREILLRLRDAAGKDTRLLIADFVLPLACIDPEAVDGGEGDGDRKGEGIEVVEVGGEGDRCEVESPLLPNLGKASANGYWMDLTMQVMFNAQERTLREMDALTRSAGWRIVRVTKTPGSMFGYLVAVPVDIPEQETSSSAPSVVDACQGGFGLLSPLGTRTTIDREGGRDEDKRGDDQDKREKENMRRNMRAATAGATPGLRCGTPTFGSSTRLSSVGETLASRQFGSAGRGGSVGGIRSKKPALGLRIPSSSVSSSSLVGLAASTSNTGVTATPRKKKPSPLSVQPTGNDYYGHQASPSSAPSPRTRIPSMSVSPHEGPPLLHRAPVPATARATLARRVSSANLRGSSQQLHATFGPPPPLPVPLNLNSSMSMVVGGGNSSSGSSTARQQPMSPPLRGTTNLGGYARPRRASHVGMAGVPRSPTVVPPVPRLNLNTTTTAMRNMASPVSPGSGSRPSSQFSSSRRDTGGGGAGLSSPGMVPRSSIARRASMAQLRTRAGGTTSQLTRDDGMGGNLIIAGPQPGGVLRFDSERGKGGGHVRAGSMAGSMARGGGGGGDGVLGKDVGVGVLAAAAKIESGRSYEGGEQASP